MPTGDAVAVVTGAGGGMGREIALLLRSRYNCHLALVDVSADRLRETQAELDFISTALLAPEAVATPVKSPNGGKSPSKSPAKTRGPRTSIHIVDVTHRAAVFALADEVREVHGRCDVVFNNAGVAATHAFHQVDLAAIDKVLDINLGGVINVARAFLPLLIANEKAALVCTSSMEGYFAFPGNAAYVMSKFAVRGLCDCLLIEAAELYPHVQITCVHPGFVSTSIAANSSVHILDTGIGGKNRMVKAESVNRAILTMACTTPKQAAEQIVDGVVAGRTRIVVGSEAKVFDFFVRLFPHGVYVCVSLSLLSMLKTMTH